MASDRLEILVKDLSFAHRPRSRDGRLYSPTSIAIAGSRRLWTVVSKLSPRCPTNPRVSAGCPTARCWGSTAGS